MRNQLLQVGPPLGPVLSGRFYTFSEAVSVSFSPSDGNLVDGFTLMLHWTNLIAHQLTHLACGL